MYRYQGQSEVKATGYLALAALVLVYGAGCGRPLGGHTAGESPSFQPSAVASPSEAASPSGPLTIASAAFPDGEVGVAYGPINLSAGGGAPPYFWSFTGGLLPGGLTLDTHGIVSGAPTSAGSAHFIVRVSDSANATADVQVSMKVVSALTAGYVDRCAGGKCMAQVSCQSPWPPAPERSCGEFGYVNGGAPLYTFHVTGGNLPPGPTLNALALEGLFMQAGTYTFEVTISDTLGGTARLTPTFKVLPQIGMSSAGCSGDYNTGCSVRMPYTNGIGTIQAGLSSQCMFGCNRNDPLSLPPGFSVVVTDGAVVITFPKGIVDGWKGELYVQVVDQYTTNSMFAPRVIVSVLPKSGQWPPVCCP